MTNNTNTAKLTGSNHDKGAAPITVRTTDVERTARLLRECGYRMITEVA